LSEVEPFAGEGKAGLVLGGVGRWELEIQTEGRQMENLDRLRRRGRFSE